jgi:hypothetical protein
MDNAIDSRAGNSILNMSESIPVPVIGVKKEVEKEIGSIVDENLKSIEPKETDIHGKKIFESFSSFLSEGVGFDLNNDSLIQKYEKFGLSEIGKSYKENKDKEFSMSFERLGKDISFLPNDIKNTEDSSEKGIDNSKDKGLSKENVDNAIQAAAQNAFDSGRQQGHKDLAQNASQQAGGSSGGAGFNVAGAIDSLATAPGKMIGSMVSAVKSVVSPKSAATGETKDSMMKRALSSAGTAFSGVKTAASNAKENMSINKFCDQQTSADESEARLSKGAKAVIDLPKNATFEQKKEAVGAFYNAFSSHLENVGQESLGAVGQVKNKKLTANEAVESLEGRKNKISEIMESVKKSPAVKGDKELKESVDSVSKEGDNKLAEMAKKIAAMLKNFFAKISMKGPSPS